MAGNKINPKNKGKNDGNKTNKIIQYNEDNEEIDFSLLRKPILTSVTGFAQARKIFDWATEELKGLLSNECDLLYECKVCRNIFRSLANFISHKRVYCKETFNSSVHSHFTNPSSTANEILKIKRLEEGYQESLKDENSPDAMDTNENDDRIPLTKDLTTIIEKIAKIKGINEQNPSNHNIMLQKIPSSSVAVFQSVDYSEDKQIDKMRTQVKELDDILSKDKAVLQSDGKFKTQSSVPPDSENVIQISDDDDNDNLEILKCKICEQQFSTQKTLKFHMKYKHLESRLVYPCPDCLEIFSTSWSVYRHLFKVHRKTAAQIRKLREAIQAKAFRMNNPPAFYEKRKNLKPASVQKITEEERLDQENQAWMDNVEGDGDTPRCFGCGRSFERRAALVSHTHTCQPRSRALARRPVETKKIEIQIRKDYNKGPPTTILPLKNTETIDTKAANETNNVSNKTGKEAGVLSNQSKDLEEAIMDVLENSKSYNATEAQEETEEKSKVIPKTISKLPFARQTEKNNLAAFKQKIQSDIDAIKLLCKRCDVAHNNIQELHDHMAVHYKWMRYACKLCNFKHYKFEKLPEHVKVVHKLKGDTDFYFSTVKALDGTEALELSESLDEFNETNEISPDSRRPSRCSSDSSRLSDESSSSSTRPAEAGSRKRKLQQNKIHSKRRRDIVNDDDGEMKIGEMSEERDTQMLVENDSSSMTKTFEENSSDIDDIDEKFAKRQTEDISSVASRRPIRKKTKPKNEDFEYDLSNLLKMEAQGYRDSQSVSTSKINQNKKKVMQSENLNNYDNLNKDCCGALIVLSKKAVENASAHMKTTNFILPKPQKESRHSNLFVRPMLPKIIRNEKISPKKDTTDESKDNSSPPTDSVHVKKPDVANSVNNENCENKKSNSDSSGDSCTNKGEKPSNVPNLAITETTQPNLNIPAVVPIKFRRQSLEVIKNNPIINKNLSDFTKAGMKTKILVIKPINRNKDGSTAANNQLKFQTIKLKDPSKASTAQEKSPDQVVLVKVPKVECASSRSNDLNAKDSDDKLSSNMDASANIVVNSEITDNISDSNVNIQNHAENSNSENRMLNSVNNKLCDNELDSNVTEIVSNVIEAVSNITELVSKVSEPVSNDTKLISNLTEPVTHVTAPETHITEPKNIDKSKLETVKSYTEASR